MRKESADSGKMSLGQDIDEFELPVHQSNVEGIQDVDMQTINTKIHEILQILANFKEWKGRRIVSYKFPEGVNYEKLEEDRDHFINQHSFFVPLKKKLFDKNAQMECDMYFKVASSSDGKTADFLSGAVIDIHDKTGIAEGTSLNDRWVFIEITQGPQFLVHKLWQLERAVQLLPQVSMDFEPLSLVVLLNGEEQDARKAIDLIKIPEGAKIAKYPLFIGWTPTRNIFKSFQNLENNVAILQSDVASLKSDMGDVKILLQQLVSRQPK
jgi:hypothetical protein